MFLEYHIPENEMKVIFFCLVVITFSSILFAIMAVCGADRLQEENDILERKNSKLEKENERYKRERANQNSGKQGNRIPDKQDSEDSGRIDFDADPASQEATKVMPIVPVFFDFSK